MRVGFGFDIHKLESGRKLYIGGVEIKSNKGAVAHSDGDVLLHSLCDAILGAAGLGDMGDYFPSSSPEFKDIRSTFFVEKVIQLIREKDLAINNCDSTVFLETVDLSDFKNLIKENLAKLLNLNKNKINIKAKTMQGLGEIGSKNAAASATIVTLKKFGEPE